MSTIINFPSSPTIGDTYTYGTTTYKWSGVTWYVITAAPLYPGDVGSTIQPYNANTTTQGNTFNGNSQLVKTEADGKLPAIDGSLLINLPAPTGGAGTKDFVATGTIGAGQVVGLRSDGTVEIIQPTTISESLGNTVRYSTAESNLSAMVHDTINDQIIIVYNDNFSDGRYVIGTILGDNISFDPSVTFGPLNMGTTAMAFDPTVGKVVVIYEDKNNGSLATSMVGIVSVGSITFGSPEVFNGSGVTYYSELQYDPSSGKMVAMIGISNYPWVMVGNISGNTIAWGTKVQVNTSQSTTVNSIIADTINERIVLTFVYSSDIAKSRVGTISGLDTITLGATTAEWDRGVKYPRGAFHPSSGQFVICYRDNDNLDRGTAIVGKVDIGTNTISFGSPVLYETGKVWANTIAYDIANDKFLISYSDDNNGRYAKVLIGTVSGTSISFVTSLTIRNLIAYPNNSVYDNINKKLIINQGIGGGYGEASVYVPQLVSTNAASTIGIATASVSDTATGTITILGGVNAQQTGLTTGLYYYVDYQGNITTTPNTTFEYKVLGKAVSATEILVEVDKDDAQIIITESQISDLQAYLTTVNIADLGDELSGIATLPTGDNAINFKAKIHYDKTLDANWSPTITDPVKGKSIVIMATGGAFTLTLPASVKGDVSGFDGTMTNQLTLYCVDDVTPVYSVTLLNW